MSVRTEAGLKPLVENLSFTLSRGETLAIMGLLLPPIMRVTAGTIRLGQTDLTAAPGSQLRRIRGDCIALIFQEPMTSLNPVLTIGTQVAEAIRAHEDVTRAEADSRALSALTSVRPAQPERRMMQLPHELSGGMRQRVMIAMALALHPEVLIADEPTTALDVTVQREVLDLLRDLQRDLGTAIILITRDMGVVAEMADRVIVMKSGRMVEEAPVRAADLMLRLGLSKDQLERYPHAFSGGQRRRICIARALALRPELIIADEGVSALDVNVQKRVLSLLKELQEEMGVAHLFISHDIGVVDSISDRVAVMFLGPIVELGTRDQFFGNPQHSYTRRLIDAGQVPDPFHPRSPLPRLSG